MTTSAPAAAGAGTGGAPRRPSLVPVEAGRPGLVRIWWAQVRHANSTFWRTPIAAFFTLIFPVTFLVIIMGIVGNVVVDTRTGLHLAQLLAPSFAVFGLVMASYSTPAIALTTVRELGVLRRVRGTPAPRAVYLAGRMGSVVWTGLLAFVVVVVVGVAAYDVTVVRRTLPALVVTLVLGVGTFAALGLVVSGLSPTPAAAQGIANGTFLPLAFVSGLFTNATLPRWLATIGDFFPLKHLNAAVTACFDPAKPGGGWYGRDLAIVAIWGVVATVAAVRMFRWEPRTAGTAHRRHRGGVTDTTEPLTPAGAAEPGSAQTPRRAPGAPAATVRLAGSVRSGRPPSTWSLLSRQARHTNTAAWRTPTAVFFAVAFPIMLIVIFSLSHRHLQWQGVDIPQYLTAVMAVYGIATAGYLSLAQDVATAREQLVLKRLRGSALPPWVYLAGQALARLWLAAVIVVACFAVGAVFFGVTVPLAGVPTAVLTYAFGTVCFAALGLMLVALLPSATAVTSVGLGTLVPLAFVSDIFMVGTPLPRTMELIGDVFPLKHFADAAFAATSPAATSYAPSWGDLAVMALWAAGAGFVGWRRFRWEPEPGRVHIGHARRGRTGAVAAG